MILSERGAIRFAITDGGFGLYPAGRILDYIKQALPGDELKGNFDMQQTADKIANISGPQDEAIRAVFEKDKNLLCSRLKEMDSNYDLQSVFDKMNATLPQLAKRYYGIDEFNPVTPQIVEYYFEGHNEIYKDADWFAFNVNEAESGDLNVPVGTYFKRDQVSPGQAEFAVMHEANHAMQALTALPPGVHHYVPWLDEGLADVFGRMMLYAVTNNDKLLKRIKNFKMEVESTDPRKVTYHYGEEIAAMLLWRGRLPLVRALLSARKDAPYDFDWGNLAMNIKTGIDPHIGIINAYRGSKKDTFQKRLTRNEMKFRKESDLNQADLKVLSMFLDSQPPATLNANEYQAACWLIDEIKKEPSPHFVDPKFIPEGLRTKINEWKDNIPLAISSIPPEVLNKIPGIETKIAIKDLDIPEHLKPAVSELAKKYFVVKKLVGELQIYEPHSGGLPIRFKSGEIRCSW